MLLEDALHHGQAQAGAGGLGGVEGLPKVGQVLRGDAGAGVGNRAEELGAGLAGTDGEPAAMTVHGFQAVEDKIQDDLFELGGIPEEGPGGLVVPGDRNMPREAVLAEKLERLVNERGELHGGELGRDRLGEFQELLDDAVNPFDFPTHDLRKLLPEGRILVVGREVLGE